MLNKNAEVLLRNTPIPDPSLLQDKLVSGTNIKTINGTSLLGSGDISLGGVGSVNGQTGDVVLTAPDVEAVPVDNRQFIDLAGAGADFILGWSHATYTKGLNYNSNYQAATDHQVIPVAVSYLDNGAVYRVYNDTLYTIVLTATDNMGTPSGTINGVASIDLPSFSFVELTGVGGNAIVVHSDQTYLIYNLVPEAPIDGTDYVRKDGAWVASTGGGITADSTDTLTNKTINDISNYVDADALHLKAFNASGGVTTVGMAVYNDQWNTGAGCAEFKKARANSISTSPCHGLFETVTADGGTGSVRTAGNLVGVDTSIWSDGVDLWLSPTTAGSLTSTEPTTVGQIRQFIGTVVRQHATLGVINVQLGSASVITAPGGGSTTITQYEIDFGTTPRSDLEFTISDASVLVGSKIIATVGYEATTDNTADEAVACGLQVVVGQVAAGSFKLLGFSNTSLLKGKYKINYIIGA